jgi:hypothetical protein
MTEGILFGIWILVIGNCLGFGAWSLVLIHILKATNI